MPGTRLPYPPEFREQMVALGSRSTPSNIGPDERWCPHRFRSERVGRPPNTRMQPTDSGVTASARGLPSVADTTHPADLRPRLIRQSSGGSGRTAGLARPLRQSTC
jgi:hypothetical protein